MQALSPGHNNWQEGVYQIGVGWGGGMGVVVVTFFKAPRVGA